MGGAATGGHIFHWGRPPAPRRTAPAYGKRLTMPLFINRSQAAYALVYLATLPRQTGWGINE